jgi:hypothetical protein
MIERLVVIAAPSAAGKTRLKQELRAERLPELAARLGIERPSHYREISRKAMKKGRRADRGSHVLFECNLTPGYLGGRTYDRDELTIELLDQAREIAFLTLWTPPSRLVHQRRERERQRLMRDLRNAGARIGLISRIRRAITLSIVRHLPAPAAGAATWLLRTRPAGWILGNRRGGALDKLAGFYLQPAAITQCYREWLAFCDRYVAKTRLHLIAEFHEELRLYDRAEWERVASRYG